MAVHVIDVGSGAGFPGLPTKIWAPHIRLTLIEANQKKATFLREVVRHLGLANVDVFAARARRTAKPREMWSCFGQSSSSIRSCWTVPVW